MAVLVGVTMFSGCAMERHITPNIVGTPRTGLELQPPLIGSVFDGRSTQDEKDAIIKLQADLTRLYGSSIDWRDYFSKTPQNRVAVRVRLVTLV